MKTIYKKLIVLMAFHFAASTVIGQEQYAPGTEGELREITIRLPHISEPQTLEVEVIDGIAILEGDIELGEIENLVSGSGRGGATTTSLSVRWPNGVIPYEIDAASISSPAHRAIVQQAANEVASRTNLTLRPKTAGDTNYVKFVNIPRGRHANGYSSRMGMVTGEQTIKIKLGGSHPIKGKIMHEIGHAAGLYHEHTRFNRDLSIHIDFSNIKAGTWTNQYVKFASRRNYGSLGGTNVGPYDFESIMHYGDGRGSEAAMDSSKPIITTKPPGIPIGQRRTLSPGDISAINSIYSGTTTAATGTNATGTSGSSTMNDSDSATIEEIETIIWEVPLVRQTTSMSCWAAAAAMVVGYREQWSMNPETIAGGKGGWGQVFYNNGLPPDNIEMFSLWGLTYVYPQSYTVEGFADLLRRGPLWVATDLDGSPHVVVVYEMSGNGTASGTTLSIHDPIGRMPTTQTYAEFTQGLDNLGRAELSEPEAYYIAY